MQLEQSIRDLQGLLQSKQSEVTQLERDLKNIKDQRDDHAVPHTPCIRCVAYCSQYVLNVLHRLVSRS